MANSSATGGYLAPIAISPPLEDAELEALLHGFIAGVSGLPTDMVRTRWPAAGVPPSMVSAPLAEAVRVVAVAVLAGRAPAVAY